MSMTSSVRRTDLDFKISGALTFITVADDNNGAVTVDNGDQLVICLFI